MMRRGPILLSHDLHARLARLWEAKGRPALVPIVDSELAEAEKAVGSVIPDQVLGLLVAMQRTPYAVVDATESLRAYRDAIEDTGRAGHTLPIAFDTWGDYPSYSAGFEPTRDPREAALVIWDWKKWAPLPPRGGHETIESFLEMRYGEGSKDDIDFSVPPSQRALAAFAPEIIEKPVPQQRFVRHSKFGVGRVLRELPDRLEIDFGEHGTRTVLPTFVIDTREQDPQRSPEAPRQAAPPIAHAVAADEVAQPAAPEPKGRAAARAIMERVRENATILAERWRAYGFTLASPIGARGAQLPKITEIERRVGSMPETLRAFYEVVGWIDFAERPTSEIWPDDQCFDPLQLWPLPEDVDALVGSDDARIDLFGDPLIKMGYGGVGAIYTVLPATGIDADLYFEDERIAEWQLVGYLRFTILERGGIGPGTPDDELSTALIRELTRDLVPF